MNKHVTGVILLNDTQIPHVLNFHLHFRETVISNNIYKIHDENAGFFKWSCCINIDKNNYPGKTDLDTNTSLTVAQTLNIITMTS